MVYLVSLVVYASTLLTLLISTRQVIMSMVFRFVGETSGRFGELEEWPSISVIVPAHNEELVIDGSLRTMRKLSYPTERLEIVVINDRSSDATGEIADRHAAEDPRIRVIHRPMDATPGKPAALSELMPTLASDVAVFFDADYLPPQGLAKQLVQPFARPDVGATMGRVVPYNTDTNLMTKLIDLERRSGYVVDQGMRAFFGLLPQFGGTCGAVRLSALQATGGWKPDLLAEDTDLTYRLFLQGMTVAYLPNAKCYEESPEDWKVRLKQVRRWAYGHNDCMFRYLWPVLKARHKSILSRLDAAIVLLFYFAPILALMTLVLITVFPSYVAGLGGYFLGVSFLALFSGFGNFAPYFQVGVACFTDGQPRVLRSLPMLFLSSFLSMLAATSGLFNLIRDRLIGKLPTWDKTVRFRRESKI